MTDGPLKSAAGTVLLREVEESDLPVFFEQQRDPVSAAMAAFTSRERDAFLAHWAKILVDPECTIRTILFDGRVAGHVASFHRFGKREVGYWIGREDWGKGIASRALADFVTLDTTRPLYARVAKHNARSLRVLEKCGFTVSSDPDEEAEPLPDGIEEFMMKLAAGPSA